MCKQGLNHMTLQKNWTIELPNESATHSLARTLASLFNRGEQLALKGDLGSGKTVFVRAFVKSLCGQSTDVPSPTFTLLQTYDTMDGRELFHYDLYRLKRPDEALELDIDYAFAEGITLIEWPEKVSLFLPDDHLKIKLSYGQTEFERIAVINAEENWSKRLRKISL